MEKIKENRKEEKMNKYDELKKITGVIEENYNKYITNTGYRINDTNYIYGEHIIEKGINVDVDDDKIIPNVLYVWLDNKYYKVIEEDIEDIEYLKENYFVISSKKNGDEFVDNFKTEEEALNFARTSWNHLTLQEKEKTTIRVGKGIFEELNGYNPIKEYTCDYLIDFNTWIMNEEVIGDLDEAKRVADYYASYTQKNITIFDNEGNKVAQRNWQGIAYDNADVEEEDPIEFGSNGYYSDWVEF